VKPAHWSADNGLAATDSRLRFVDIRHLSVDNRRMSADIALMSVAPHPLSAADRPLDVVPIHFRKEVPMAPGGEMDLPIAFKALGRSDLRPLHHRAPRLASVEHKLYTPRV
jgi:hypothetical protein